MRLFLKPYPAKRCEIGKGDYCPVFQVWNSRLKGWELSRGHITRGRSQTRTHDHNSQNSHSVSGKEVEPSSDFTRFHAAPQTETALLLHTLPHSLIPSEAGRSHSAYARGNQGPSLPPCFPGSHPTPRLGSNGYPRTHQSRPTPLRPEAALPESSAQSALMATLKFFLRAQ